MGLLSKVERLREIALYHNDERKEWFGKYMTYKRHEEARIMCLLLRHFPFSNMAGHDLAQDKIIYLWDIQSTKWATEADKLEREEN